MNIASIIILIFIALGFIKAIKYMIKNKSCCGSCNSCSRCNKCSSKENSHIK